MDDAESTKTPGKERLGGNNEGVTASFGITFGPQRICPEGKKQGGDEHTPEENSRNLVLMERNFSFNHMVGR